MFLCWETVDLHTHSECLDDRNCGRKKEKKPRSPKCSNCQKCLFILRRIFFSARFVCRHSADTFTTSVICVFSFLTKITPLRTCRMCLFLRGGEKGEKQVICMDTQRTLTPLLSLPCSIRANKLWRFASSQTAGQKTVRIEKTTTTTLTAITWQRQQQQLSLYFTHNHNLGSTKCRIGAAQQQISANQYNNECFYYC